GRSLPPRGRLRRPHPQGREGRRYAGAGANQVRAGHQPQDRQDARHRNSADPARPRRRGDRMMHRRAFVTLLGGAAAAWPFASRAQQPGKVPTIGFLGSGTPITAGAWVVVFAQRLRELGWIEDRTVKIDLRWAEGRNDRSAEIATDLVRQK